MNQNNPDKIESGIFGVSFIKNFDHCALCAL